MFKAAFSAEKWSILFELTSKVCAYMEKANAFAERVSSELNVLKDYIHSDMRCLYIIEGWGTFPLDFENCIEFLKFFIFTELYSMLDINILKDEFFNNISIVSFYDLYEFLPLKHGNISKRVRNYMDPQCNRCCCCYICGWYYGSPWLSNYMHKLVDKQCRCEVCKDFAAKFYRYATHFSLYTALIADVNPNDNIKVPTFFVDRVQTLSELNEEWNQSSNEEHLW